MTEPLDATHEGATEGVRWERMIFAYRLTVIDIARFAGLPPAVARRLADGLATDADIARAVAEHRACTQGPIPCEERP